MAEAIAERGASMMRKENGLEVGVDDFNEEWWTKTSASIMERRQIVKELLGNLEQLEWRMNRYELLVDELIQTIDPNKLLCLRKKLR